MNEMIELHNPSFLERWLHQFFFERHALAARAILFLTALSFFIFGPNLIVLLIHFLPTAQLGSSGASILAHQTLQVIAGSACGLVLALLLRPSVSALLISETGLQVKKRILIFPVTGKLLSWEKIDRIAIERQKNKTDMRCFRLLLRSDSEPQRSIRIPLSNLRSQSSKDRLVNLIQERAVKAIIEPGSIEAIKPAGNLSFTEIWLEALSAAPSRQRLIPLADASLLKERFTILKRLGGGGQATAYLARDSQTDNEIVLKETILPVYADLPTRKQALSKFHDEALALKSVKHSGIVRFLDSFVEDHRAYLVLQYIEGFTLRKTIENGGSLSNAEALRLALQMCEILETLHGLNPPLVHRDFTPDNLILNKEGNLVLIDFAVATTDEDCQEAAGKIAYMAPEQFQGNSSTQTDIYSCGCSLFYILTGEDPVGLSTSHPSKTNSSVSSELDAIVAKATEQSRELRYRNIAELKMDLQQLQDRISI